MVSEVVTKAPIVGPVLGWLRRDPSSGGVTWLQRILVVLGQEHLGEFVALRISLSNESNAPAKVWYCGATCNPDSGHRSATFDVAIPQAGFWSICVEGAWTSIGGFSSNNTNASAAGVATLTPQHFDEQAGRSFVIAACRFPGFGADKLRADAMLEILARQPISFALYLGDSIYADSAQVRAHRTEVQRYVRAYQSAFSSPGFARALSSVPSYFIPDDHEFWNDWSVDQQLLDSPLGAKWFNFANAFDAYSEYEFGIGPRNLVEDLPLMGLVEDASTAQCAPGVFFRVTGEQALRLGATSGKWGPHYRWSHSTLAGLPFFLADTRTERHMLAGSAQIWSQTQFETLSTWLAQRDPYALKFIALSQPVAPAPLDVAHNKRSGEDQDAWWGYPESLTQLLAMLGTSGQHGIVLVAGDSHFGTSCRLQVRVGNRDPIEILSVVSSGLYIPLRGVNAKRSDYFVSDPSAHARCYENGWMRYDPGCSVLASGEELHTLVWMDCAQTVFTEHIVKISVTDAPSDPSAKGLSPPSWPTLDFVRVTS
jgi:PhoD-like phosphatase